MAGAVIAFAIASSVGVSPAASAAPMLPVPAAGTAAEPPARAAAPAASAAPAAQPVDLAAAPRVAPLADRAIVTLTALNPTVVAPGAAVTITGTITAPTTGPLTAPRVRLVQGASPVVQRSQIDTWASGADPASGPELGSVTLPTVAPSQTARFVLSLPGGTVRSDKAFAALPVSVEVVQAGAAEPVGIARTFLAWNARKEYEKLQVATVLPITLDPDVDLFSRDEKVRDPAWRSTIGPGSRIRRIIDGTKGGAVTLAVDPAVFGPEPIGQPTPATSGSGTPGTPSTTSTTSTDAATPPDPSSSATSGTTTGDTTGTPAGADDEEPGVAALSAGLVDALAERTLWALPYADADLAATVDIAPTNPLVRDLVDRSSLVADAVGHPVRSDILWPADGRLPAGREGHLATLLAGTNVKKAAGVVVNQEAISGASSYTPTARRVATGGTRLLGYDARLSALLPDLSGGASTNTSVALPVQRYLAETLVVLGERAGTARSLLVVAPRTYDPDAGSLAAFLAATSAAPWLTPVDAASLVSDSGPDRALKQQPPVSSFPATLPPPTLNQGRLALMEFQRETLGRVAGVLRDGDQFERTYREVLDELASVRWRFQPASWTQLSVTVEAQTKAATSAIKVVAQSVNFLAENGTLQITVDNGLPYEVEDIRLVLAPTNPRMQIVRQPGPISIAPNSKRVVRVPVTAVAAGAADIRAYLTTADGTPIGSPAVIPVSANPIDGTVYWVGGALVGLVLLLGVARAIVKGTSRIDEISDAPALAARHDRDVRKKSP
ncbi:hypothetical protein BA895_11440 [Humibacillus sp. DSM 29435]|nr:hypothetical protein BA895_11440 [Humibacillus sp. DSM 29435]